MSKSRGVASSSSFYTSIRSIMYPPQCVHTFKIRCIDCGDDNAVTLWRSLSPMRTTFNVEGAKLETKLQLSGFTSRTWSVLTYLCSFVLQG